MLKVVQRENFDVLDMQRVNRIPQVGVGLYLQNLKEKYKRQIKTALYRPHKLRT